MTVLALALALAGATPSAEKMALVNELIQLTHATDTGVEGLVMLLSSEGKFPPEKDRDPAVDRAIQRTTADILAEHLTERQLRELIAFFKTNAGRAYCDAVGALTKERLPRLAAELDKPTPKSAVKRTMADMRTLATASEAYGTDYNKYPDAKTLAELANAIAPTYIRVVPEKDGWGTPFAYFVSADHQTYRFVSAGPDRKFDPSSLKLGTKPSASDDIVYENGEFVQAPAKTP